MQHRTLSTRRRARRRAGMTLIEVMAVVVIMAMIAVAVGANVLEHLRGARIRETATRARTIQHAVVAYMLDYGDECPSASDLDPLLDPTTDRGDAWGNAFEISCDGTVVHVRSRGPDEELGTDDDIEL